MHLLLEYVVTQYHLSVILPSSLTMASDYIAFVIKFEIDSNQQKIVTFMM